MKFFLKSALEQDLIFLENLQVVHNHIIVAKNTYFKTYFKALRPPQKGKGTNLNGKHLHILKNMFSIIIIYTCSSYENDFYCVLLWKILARVRKYSIKIQLFVQEV